MASETVPGPPPESAVRTAVIVVLRVVAYVVVIGGIFYLVVPQTTETIFPPRGPIKTELDILDIASALEDYARENGGEYPATLKVLVTPNEHGQTYLFPLPLPLDRWQRPYRYEPPGPGQLRPRVYTLGEDGEVGGEGDDADVDSQVLLDIQD